MSNDEERFEKEPLQIIKGMYAAANRGDMTAVMDAYDESVVIEEAASLPFGGIYKGKDGYRMFLAAFTGQWEHFSNIDLQVLEAGEFVIGLSRLKAISKRGVEVDVPLAEFFRVREGKIVELRPFYFDGGAVTKAIGGS